MSVGSTGDRPAAIASFRANPPPEAAPAVRSWYLGSAMPKKRVSPTRETLDALIAQRAARQFGIISRDQAARLGATRSMIESRLGRGRWSRVHPGVYRLAGTPPSWRGSLVAACLAYGAPVGASHRAAAALWSLPSFPEGIVEVVVPRERGRLPGILVHRTLLSRADLTSIGSIPVTTPSRTIIDIASIAPVAIVDEALDDALRRGLVSISTLRRRIKALTARGRSGIASVRSLVEMREPGAAVPMSIFETRLLRLLRDHGLPQPLLQYEIRDRGRLVARPDFAFPDLLLAVEADSRRWHGGRAAWARDLARRNALTTLGWSVVHVTWDDLTRRPAEVVATIAAAVSLPARRHGGRQAHER